jgi:hypothetical protein
MTILAAMLLALPAAAVASRAKRDSAPWVIGLELLHRLDLLPTIKRATGIGGVSSYDRTGGNDDGFSGAYSYIRKEGDDLVLADIEGPGCIYRIHTPTPPDDIVEFYFDGEETPRIRLPFREMFSGNVEPFVRPLVHVALGGCTSYVPIPFSKSCKILLRAKEMHFYDLNYTLYPPDAPVTTYSPTLAARDRKAIAAASAVFSGGRDQDLTAFNVPQGTKLTKHPFDAQLQPGQAVTLFETDRGGRIASLRIEPAEALSGKGRDILLRITWDGDARPAVCCPAGDFFGYAWGEPAAGCCVLGTHRGVDYFNLPMPFEKSARVELLCLRPSGPAVRVAGEVVVGDTPKRKDECRFYAVWRRENPTTEGKPFTFLETSGRGHIVGLALQAQGKQAGNTFFFEGDDQTTVDGELAVHGTGTEDFLNGGWYDIPGRWDRRQACPLSGCMLYERPLGRTGGYRFFLSDAYSYRRSVLQAIEHAPERNEHPADYCAVTYLYSEKRPKADFSVPSVNRRAVDDPRQIVFTPHWTLPILGFSFAGATISRGSQQVGGADVRCLTMRADRPDIFGPAFISFGCKLPARGRYRISVDAIAGPDQAVVQLFHRDVPIGERVDLYRSEQALVEQVAVGELEVEESEVEIVFKLMDKHADSSGLGLDLVNVIFERVG